MFDQGVNGVVAEVDPKVDPKARLLLQKEQLDTLEKRGRELLRTGRRRLSLERPPLTVWMRLLVPALGWGLALGLLMGFTTGAGTTNFHLAAATVIPTLLLTLALEGKFFSFSGIPESPLYRLYETGLYENKEFKAKVIQTGAELLPVWPWLGRAVIRMFCVFLRWTWGTVRPWCKGFALLLLAALAIGEGCALYDMAAAHPTHGHLLLAFASAAIVAAFLAIAIVAVIGFAKEAGPVDETVTAWKDWINDAVAWFGERIAVMVELEALDEATRKEEQAAQREDEAAEAKAIAEEQQTRADAARQEAEAAQKNAESAENEGVPEAAKQAAETAKRKAEIARQAADIADAAQRKADAARQQADVARQEADAAEQNAEAAREKAEAANQNAEAAKQQAEAANDKAAAQKPEADVEARMIFSRSQYTPDKLPVVMSPLTYRFGWATASPPSAGDPAARLEQLAKLRDGRVLNDEEYQAARRPLVDALTNAGTKSV